MDDLNCLIHKNKICECFCITCNKFICIFCLAEHIFFKHLTYELSLMRFDEPINMSKDLILPEIKQIKKRKEIKQLKEIPEIKKIPYPKCQYCFLEVKSDKKKLNCNHIVHTKCLYEYF